MRMGYHREPRHFSRITPFEGEMRRRVFFLVQTFDLLLSSQAGLPAIITEESCDIDPPSNLFDSDFDEDTIVLPPSRPWTDSTPVLYSCYKGNLCKVYREVYRQALSRLETPYNEVMRLDEELRKIHKAIPPSLAPRPISTAYADETYLLLYRLNSELIYQKSLCTLHRYYLSNYKQDATYDFSRKACADAAIQMLRLQEEIYEACRPGQRFQNDEWMLSTLVTHDFLLAAMVLCQDLHESGSSSRHNTIAIRFEEYDALKISRDIWKSRKAFSKDIRSASNVLERMVCRLSRQNGSYDDASCSPKAFHRNTRTAESFDVVDKTGVVENGNPTLGATISNGATRSTVSAQDNSSAFNPIAFDDTLLNGAEDIDWVRLYLTQSFSC